MMRTFDMQELDDTMMWGDGVPGVERDDHTFKVDGILYATAHGANSPSLRSGARFVSGGFKPGNDGKMSALLFRPGTIIEIPK